MGGRRWGRAPWEVTAPYQQGKSLLSYPTRAPSRRRSSLSGPGGPAGMEFGKLCRRTAQTHRQAVGERRWVEGGAPGRSEQWSSGRRAFLPRWPSRHPLKQRAFPPLPLGKVLHRGRAGRALESLGPTAHLAGPPIYACWLKRGVWGDRALWGKGRHQWLRPHRSPCTPGGRGRGRVPRRNPCWTAGLGRD